MRATLYAFAIVLAAIALACGSRASDVGQTGRPVVVMLSPSHAPPGTEGERGKLATWLEKETGLKVKVEAAPTPQKAIEAFGSAEADLGLLSPTEYLFAREEYRVEARLQVHRKDGGLRYTGDIVVKADSPLKAVEELAGKKVAFTDGFSTSGFLLPAALLADREIEVEPVMTGGHDPSLALLKDDEVAAAATYHGAAARDAGLRVLATTSSIPNEPILVRHDLGADKAKALIGALVKYAGTPEGLAVLGALADIDGLQPVEDAAYDALLAEVQKAGVAVADLVPGGRTISWSNNPILGPE